MRPQNLQLPGLNSSRGRSGNFLGKLIGIATSAGRYEQAARADIAMYHAKRGIDSSFRNLETTHATNERVRGTSELHEAGVKRFKDLDDWNDAKGQQPLSQVQLNEKGGVAFTRASGYAGDLKAMQDAKLDHEKTVEELKGKHKTETDALNAKIADLTDRLGLSLIHI